MKKNHRPTHWPPWMEHSFAGGPIMKAGQIVTIRTAIAKHSCMT